MWLPPLWHRNLKICERVVASAASDVNHFLGGLEKQDWRMGKYACNMHEAIERRMRARVGCNMLLQNWTGMGGF